MLRHVRNVDRSLHVDSYPELYYPELYLIEGGYKHCFETLRHELCAPLALYVAMRDKRFTEMCRHEFAVWKRSWKLHRTVAKCVAKVKMSEKVSSCCDQARPTISGVRSLYQEL
uniref:Uncharacterized protein n=1 Tax=Hyaloperonospora arabidopsidis (strain Emoy2) TaxID=559515 RepID=M4B9S4_HYAAE